MSLLFSAPAGSCGSRFLRCDIDNGQKSAPCFRRVFIIPKNRRIRKAEQGVNFCDLYYGKRAGTISCAYFENAQKNIFPLRTAPRDMLRARYERANGQSALTTALSNIIP